MLFLGGMGGVFLAGVAALVMPVSRPDRWR